MHLIKVMAAIVLAGLLGGCRTHVKPAAAPAPPASADTVRSIRAMYQKSDPMARVGRVMSVGSDASMAAVEDVPVGDFKAGDVVTFIDSDQEPIATGTVRNISGSALHIKYEARPTGRAPRAGDLMVRFIRPM